MAGHYGPRHTVRLIPLSIKEKASASVNGATSDASNHNLAARTNEPEEMTGFRVIPPNQSDFLGSNHFFPFVGFGVAGCGGFNA